jgi:SAM-dependent methyltransferase
MIVHEATYSPSNVVSVIHRTRLRAILKELKALPLPQIGRYADFGCSNGYILDLVRSSVLSPQWRCVGYDRNRRLLELARARGLDNTRFAALNLNKGRIPPVPPFTLCTSFETLEHTGNFRAAITTIVESCAPEGWILVSIPVEKRLPGLLKLLSRPLVRRRPYGDFFEGRSRWEYARDVALGRDIERHRAPVQDGWGPHLGFDCDRFEEFLQAELIETGRCTLLRAVRTFGGFNRLYLLRRPADLAAR